MYRREAFKKLMQHEAGAPVMLDIGGTPMTGFGGEKQQRALGRLLGLGGEGSKEAIMQALGSDFRLVGDIIETKPTIWNQARTEYLDSWGVRRRWTGQYWDIVESPLAGADIKELKAFPWPSAVGTDPKLLQKYKEQAKHLYEDSDFIVVGSHPVYGVLELGCWLCGFEDFLYRLLAEPDFVNEFFTRVYQYQAEIIALYYEALGPYLHVTTSGDDFGTQRGPLLSAPLFEEMVAPWYHKRITLTKQYTAAHYFHHSCGSVFQLIPAICRTGVEILNPIQVGALDMEPERLKSSYGEQLTFWGGIDEQFLLTYGSPEEVEAVVTKTLRLMGDKGGYVAAPTHNLQDDVPPENIIAFCRAVTGYVAGRASCSAEPYKAR